MTHEPCNLEVSVADGLGFHVVRRGVGPAVVLLHGFTGSADNWHSLQKQLENRFTTLAVDATGHGGTAAPSDPARYALTRFARDLREILDTLGVERAVVLGYSMGGRAALRFALMNPDRVAGLIVESTSPGIEDRAERAARLEADAALADVIEREGIAAFIDRWERLPLWAGLAHLGDGALDGLRHQRLTNRVEGLAGSLRGAGAGSEDAVIDQLHTIRTSVLIIAGALDRKYVALAGLMAAQLPEATVTIVPGAGHMVHLEKPEGFAGLVSGFLEERVGEGGDWL